MTTKLKMNRNTYRYLESEISSFADTQKEYQRRRAELLTDRQEVDEAQSSSKPNTISNPTERYALRLVDDKRLAKLREIIEAIQTVYDASTHEHKQFIEMNYWQKPRARTIDGIAIELGVSPRTLYRMRNEIVYNLAKKLGIY